MTMIRAHYDGNVFVPDEAVDVPVGAPLLMQVEPIPSDAVAIDNLLEPVILGLDARLSRAIASDPEFAAENM
jgi:hypothetical protein